MKQKSNTIRSSLLLLLTAAIWGVAFVAQSVGMEYVGGFTFNCIRFLIGGLVLVPVYLVLDRKQARQESAGSGNAFMRLLHDRTLLTGGLVCGFFLCLASNFQQFGIKYTTVGKAGFITACYIVLVPVIGLFLHKKTGPFIWAAVLLALIGLYLLCITDGFSLGRGDFLVMICAVLFAFQILSVDHFSSLVSNGVALAMIQFFVCGILSGIPALIFESVNPGRIMAARLPILYAGIMSSGVAYTLQIIAQKDLDPTVASLIMSLESCISVLAGWLILGQSLSARELIGCAVMFGAIVLAQLPEMDLRELLGTWLENTASFKVGSTVSGIIRSVENYGIFIELAPNLAGLAELRDMKFSLERLRELIGCRAAVYIKSMIPEKMKIKLVLIDCYGEADDKENVPPLKYYVNTSRVRHVDRWIYSPPGCGKIIESIFDTGR